MLNTEIILDYLRRDRWFIILTAGFLVWYLLPLVDYDSNLAGVASDPMAHAAQTEWFCELFFEGDMQTDRYYAPQGVDLANSYDMPLLNALVCPLSALGGVAMLNTLAALQILLIFGVSYGVAGQYLSSKWLRWTFTWLYAFSGFTLTRLDVHVNILATVWSTPLIYWIFDRVTLRRRRQVLTAFLVFGLASVSVWQNIANLTFMVLMILIVKGWKQRAEWKLLGINLAFGCGVMVLVGLVFAWPILRANSEAVYEFQYQPTRHADVLSYTVPPEQHVFSKFLGKPTDFGLDFEQITPLDPLVLLGFFGVLLVSWRRKRWFSPLMLVMIGLYAWLSFGQYLSVAAHDVMSLPYYKPLSKVPPLLFTRVPARFGIVVIFLVTMYVFRYIDTLTLSRRWGAVLLGYVVWTTTAGAGNWQYTTFAYQKTLPIQALEQIRTDMGDVLVLNIPTRVDQSQNLLQLSHQKRLVSGYVSYRALTEEAINLLETDPVISRMQCFGLSDFEPPTPLIPDWYLDELDRRLDELGVGYVITNNYLLTQPGCEHLKTLVFELMPEHEGFSYMQHTNAYVVFAVN